MKIVMYGYLYKSKSNTLFGGLYVLWECVCVFLLLLVLNSNLL